MPVALIGDEDFGYWEGSGEGERVWQFHNNSMNGFWIGYILGSFGGPGHYRPYHYNSYSGYSDWRHRNLSK